MSHSRFNSRDTSHKRRSTSPMRNRESRSRNRSPYSKPQGRRSRSPYRDRDSNYRGYRDRSKSPYYRESYNSLAHREYRHRRSPPNINPPMNHRIPIPPYQMPPNFGPLWPLYEVFINTFGNA